MLVYVSLCNTTKGRPWDKSENVITSKENDGANIMKL